MHLKPLYFMYFGRVMSWDKSKERIANRFSWFQSLTVLGDSCAHSHACLGGAACCRLEVGLFWLAQAITRFLATYQADSSEIS